MSDERERERQREKETARDAPMCTFKTLPCVFSKRSRVCRQNDSYVSTLSCQSVQKLIGDKAETCSKTHVAIAVLTADDAPRKRNSVVHAVVVGKHVGFFPQAKKT